jgi:ABC-type lipoprotein export system ATPase subunit
MSKTKTNPEKTNSQEAVVVETQDLHKIYSQGTPQEVHALRGVNLKINRGEMVAIMGPSGCGKSTLLNMIGGLDEPTEGTVIIDGNDVAHLSDDERTDFRRDKIGFIFQFFNLFDVLNALENVMVPLFLQGIDPDEAEDRAKRMLREVGLGGRLYNRPSELSGGQQQRVAIARSLIINPSIILGDEPTGDLDSLTTQDIMNLFRLVKEEENQTLILVTHSDVVGQACDRIIRLKDGQVESEGL